MRLRGATVIITRTNPGALLAAVAAVGFVSAVKADDLVLPPVCTMEAPHISEGLRQKDPRLAAIYDQANDQRQKANQSFCDQERAKIAAAAEQRRKAQQEEAAADAERRRIQREAPVVTQPTKINTETLPTCDNPNVIRVLKRVVAGFDESEDNDLKETNF